MEKSGDNQQFITNLSRINGFFGNEEGAALKEFVKNINTNSTEIVEIGSFMGKSTYCIAVGIKESQCPDTRLIAIDHFEGSFEHQAGRSHENQEIVKYGTTFLSFKKNLKENNISDIVIPIATDSKIVASFWDKKIKMIFIDADHSYEGVKKDFELWEPFVEVGGFIAIHDVAYINKQGVYTDKFPGVTNFYNEIDKNKFKEVFNIGSSLRIVKKEYA